MEENNNQQNQTIGQAQNPSVDSSSSYTSPASAQASAGVNLNLSETGNSSEFSTELPVQPSSANTPFSSASSDPVPVTSSVPSDPPAPQSSQNNTPGPQTILAADPPGHKKTIVIISIVVLIIVAVLVYVLTVLKPMGLKTENSALNVPAAPPPTVTPIPSAEEQEVSNIDTGNVDADMQAINQDLQAL